MRKKKQRCKGKVQVLTYCTTLNKKYARFVLNNPMAYPTPIIAGNASGKASRNTCSVSSPTPSFSSSPLPLLVSSGFVQDHGCRDHEPEQK